MYEEPGRFIPAWFPAFSVFEKVFQLSDWYAVVRNGSRVFSMLHLNFRKLMISEAVAPSAQTGARMKNFQNFPKVGAL